MQNWFTSDLHYGHANIIRYCNRPFKNVEQMNKTLVDRWNSIVKPEDTVFHIGDFVFYGGKEAPEGITKAQEIQNMLNGTVIHLQGNHDCFSKDTRLLTIEGWKNYNEVKKGELIPTVNLIKQYVEYKPIKQVIINSVNKGYGFKSRSSEGLFSDNHRHLVMGFNWGKCGKKYKIKTSKDLWSNKSGNVLIDSFKSKNLDYNITDDELKLLGWIYTDGSIGRGSAPNSIFRCINIWQSKPKYVKEIDALLQRLGLKHSKIKGKKRKKVKIICGKKIKSSLRGYVYYIYAEYARKFLKKIKIDAKYEIPSWLYQISDRQMEVLINEMVKGDGTFMQSGSRVIWGQKFFLDKILGLCITHGRSANVVETKRKDYYLCVHKQNSGVKYISPKNRYIIDYNDIMWDVNVENHLIFTELNGKPLITGNSNNTVKAIIRNCVIHHGGMSMFLVHNPIYANPKYPINLVGHVHEKWLVRKNGKNSVCINVGVDQHNFRPININTILGIYYRYKKGLIK